MLPLIMGPIGKLAGYAALAALLAGGAAYAVHNYNKLIEAKTIVAEQASVMATMQSNHDKTVAALEKSATQATAILAARQPARKAISDAAETNICVAPTVRHAIDGLRSVVAARNPGSAPRGAR